METLALVAAITFCVVAVILFAVALAVSVVETIMHIKKREK